MSFGQTERAAIESLFRQTAKDCTTDRFPYSDGATDFTTLYVPVFLSDFFG